MAVTDQHIRDKALDVSTSFAVSAPAGSGKTGLLIRRILRLLATCDQPEQVLAITFTRKAAAEMQERVMQALLSAGCETPPTDEYARAIWQDARVLLAKDKERNWQLAHSPGRLRIMTIDSLCRNLARQLAVETELGDLPDTTDQPETYYRQAARQCLKQLESAGPVGDAIAILLRHLDNNLGALENLLVSLLAKREQWLQPLLASRGARQALESVLKNTVRETLEKARTALTTLGENLIGFADYAATNLVDAKKTSPIQSLKGMVEVPPSTAEDESLHQWLGLCELVLTKDNQWRKPGGINKNLGFPTSAKDCESPELAKERKQQFSALLEEMSTDDNLLAILTDLRHLPGIRFSDHQWQLLDALALVLPLLVAELSLLFKASNSCDFTEVTLAALKALGDEDETTDVGLKLDYQIRHILVDEFQDTSSIQFQLLRKLTAGWQQGDGRSLFIVGDGMQSLYGFRSANVGIFLEARVAPVGQTQLEPLDLEVNFRSSADIVNWINRVFSQAFPASNDISRGAVSYASAIAAHGNSPKSGVSIDVFAPDTDVQQQTAAVIKRIEAARAEDPEGSIAVLGRARSHLADIIDVLQQNGIPWQATDMDSLASRMPVVDLFSLTRALLNPADRIAWLSVLRAPWAGFSLRDLHCIVNFESDADGSPANMPWIPGQLFNQRLQGVLSADGRSRLDRIAPVLQSAINQSHRKPVRAWVEGVWLALGGPATLKNNQELTWCQQYLDLLESNNMASTQLDIEALEASLTRLYAKPDTSHQNPVHIMTIHKSKGLEFDTVILPSLHRGGGSNDSALLYWRERISDTGTTELLISPPLATGENSDSSDLIRHLKYEEKLKNQLEDARVAYVACTRAVKRLHLLYEQPKKAPTSGSLLATLWPVFGSREFAGAEVTFHESSPVTPTEADDTSSLTSIPTRLLRLTSHWQHPFSPEKPLKPAQQTDKTQNIPPVRKADSDAQHRGTLLHRTLCQIVKEGVQRWDDERTQRQIAVWRMQLGQLGAADVKGAIDQLTAALNTMLSDRAGRWILQKHSEDHCELALSYEAEGKAAQAVVDRTFVWEGSRWIIDYKSSSPATDEPLVEFLERESCEYRQQLEKYKYIMENLGPEPVRIALYFPLIPHLHELP